MLYVESLKISYKSLIEKVCVLTLYETEIAPKLP